MSIWTEARDNITSGIVNAWDSMPPTGRALLIGVCIGFAFGAAFVGLVLC